MILDGVEKARKRQSHKIQGPLKTRMKNEGEGECKEQYCWINCMFYQPLEKVMSSHQINPFPSHLPFLNLSPSSPFKATCLVPSNQTLLNNGAVFCTFRTVRKWRIISFKIGFLIT